MKSFKYTLSILLSILIILLPIVCLGAIAFLWKTAFLIPCCIAFVISVVLLLVLRKPIDTMRITARRDVEYDEFGRSKTKGSYERLSKKERDAIDLQKTADMERIMDSSALRKLTKPGAEDPQKEMDDLIGLGPVKQKMREMAARMQFEREEEANRKKDKKRKKEPASAANSMSGRHMVFFGSPGTGKTTVARIMTGFLYKYGYIKENKCVEVDGNYLKAGSDTATKTALIVSQAYGGVLFIDEAYALMYGDQYGKDAIATIIKRMEDSRNRFVLVLAGYTNEMKQLLQTNPGFESRVKEYLNFPDYSIPEMEQIFIKMAQQQGYVVTEGALTAFDTRIAKEIPQKSFGNARTVRNILDETIDRHALNCVQKLISPEDRYKIVAQDVSTKVSSSSSF